MDKYIDAIARLLPLKVMTAIEIIICLCAVIAFLLVMRWGWMECFKSEDNRQWRDK